MVGGDQVDLPAAGLRGAPQALAVHGQRARPDRMGAAVREPAPDRRVEGGAVDPGRQPPHRGLGGPLPGGEHRIGAERRAGRARGRARRRSTRLPPAGRWPRPGPRTRPGRGRRPAGGAPRADHAGPVPRRGLPAGPEPLRAAPALPRGAGQEWAISAMMRRQARSSTRITGRREVHDPGDRACHASRPTLPDRPSRTGRQPTLPKPCQAKQCMPRRLKIKLGLTSRVPVVYRSGKWPAGTHGVRSSHCLMTSTVPSSLKTRHSPLTVTVTPRGRFAQAGMIP